MKGYILNTVKNTHSLIAYDNDISIDYKEFLKGQYFSEKELPLFYNVQKKSNLNKVKSAIILESSGPELVNRRLKEILEANTKGLQFFEVNLYCGDDRIEGFYAINVPNKTNCVDMENSEFRPTNFDPNNPTYMFYYLKLKDTIFGKENIANIVRCKEMPQYIVVNEAIKKALFDANLIGLQFSDNIDITPKDRTVYEKI